MSKNISNWVRIVQKKVRGAQMAPFKEYILCILWHRFAGEPDLFMSKLGAVELHRCSGLKYTKRKRNVNTFFNFFFTMGSVGPARAPGGTFPTEKNVNLSPAAPPARRKAIAGLDQPLGLLALSGVGVFLTGARASYWPLVAAGLFFLAASVDSVSTGGSHSDGRARWIGGFFLWTLLAWGFSLCPPAGTESVLKIGSFLAFGWLAARWNDTHRRIFKILIVAGAFAYSAGAILGTFFPSMADIGLPRNPQYKAFWIVAGVLLVLPVALGFSPEERRTKDHIARRAAAWVLPVIFLIGLLLFRSRSGLIAGAIGAGALIHRRWGARGLVWFSLALTAGVILAPASGTAAVFKTIDPFGWSRTAIWKAALGGILDRPLFGWGPGLFARLYGAHRGPFPHQWIRFDHDHSFAHNDYLQLAAEYGLPALFLAGMAFGPAMKSARLAANPTRWAMLLSAAVFCLFNFPFYSPVNLLLAAGVFFGLSPANGFFSPSTARERVAWRAAFIVLGAIALGAFSAARSVRSPFLFTKAQLENRLGRADAFVHPARDKPVDPAAAETILRELLRRWPDHPEACHALGHALIEHFSPPRFEEGLPWLSRSAILQPTRAPWWMEVSAAQAALGRWPDALESAQNALRLEPEYADAQWMIARALTRIGDPAEAERFLAPLRALPPEDSASLSGYGRTIAHRDRDTYLLESAYAQLRLHNPTAALTFLSERTAPPSAESLALAVGAYLARGDRPAARRLWNDLRKGFPESPAVKLLAEAFEAVHGKAPKGKIRATP